MFSQHFSVSVWSEEPQSSVYPLPIILCVFPCTVATVLVPWLSLSVPLNSTHAGTYAGMQVHTCTVALWKPSRNGNRNSGTWLLAFCCQLPCFLLAFVDYQAHKKSCWRVVLYHSRVFSLPLVTVVFQAASNQFVSLMFAAVTGVTVCVGTCLADAPRAVAWLAGWVFSLNMTHTNTLTYDILLHIERVVGDTMDQPWFICPFVLLYIVCLLCIRISTAGVEQ